MDVVPEDIDLRLDARAEPSRADFEIAAALRNQLLDRPPAIDRVRSGAQAVVRAEARDIGSGDLEAVAGESERREVCNVRCAESRGEAGGEAQRVGRARDRARAIRKRRDIQTIVGPQTPAVDERTVRRARLVLETAIAQIGAERQTAADVELVVDIDSGRVVRRSVVRPLLRVEPPAVSTATRARGTKAPVESVTSTVIVVCKFWPSPDAASRTRTRPGQNIFINERMNVPFAKCKLV